MSSLAPLRPPRAWLDMPEADQPTPLTFTADGQVYGHLALWETCHRGFINGQFSECIKAPRSQTNYAQFYAGGQIELDSGEQVPVGRLTYNTGHAPLSAGLSAASAHYDHTGSVGAFVRARDGHLGPWISGVVRSDLSPEGLRDMRANPPSGDWRLYRSGNLELVASLAVPVPGFPVTQSQLALAASANGDLEVTALILTGPTAFDVGVDDIAERRSREFLRRRQSLSAAVLTTKQRDNLPDNAFALPGRRYPIQDRAHAANALARVAQNGTSAEQATVKRKVCAKYPDMDACG